jgi:hypothetical protein
MKNGIQVQLFKAEYYRLVDTDTDTDTHINTDTDTNTHIQTH